MISVRTGRPPLISPDADTIVRREALMRDVAVQFGNTVARVDE
jgi:hypothetical protein